MPNGFPKLPPFPTPFGEKEIERIEKLRRLSEEQQRMYGVHFVPSVWEKKPAWEKGIRRIAEKAYAPSEWFRRITPWEEYGFTPEQADVYIRETEGELQELIRSQQVFERAPSIIDYITALAARGLLTGEEAQLYELIPELNPKAPSLERLELTEEEREWFLTLGKSLVGKSEQEIYEIYMELGFPAPKTTEELMELVKVDIPGLDPRFILSTVAFSKDIEAIGAALQQAYPPQAEEDVAPYTENINTELERLGLKPTGDLRRDIVALEKARKEQLKATGKLDQIPLGDGTSILANRRDDGFYDPVSGAKIANIDPNTGEAVPLTEAEEFEASSEEILDIVYFPGIAGGAFVRDDEGKVLRKATMEEWAAYRRRQEEVPELIKVADLSFVAGIGDVMTAAGGASKWLGQDGIADLLTKKGESLQAYSLPDTLGEFHWGLVANPRFWAQRFTRIVPFTLSLLPAALFGYWAAAPVGAALAIKLGLGAFGTSVLTALAGGVGGAFLSRPLESAFEAGSAYDRAKDMGATDEEADTIATEVFVKNLSLAGVDAAQIAAAFAPIPLKVGASLIRRGLVRVARIGGRMVILGLTEAGEEAYQEVILRQALGIEIELDPEMQQVMVLGGAMGLSMGAGGDVLSGIIGQTKENMSPSQEEKFDADVEEVGEKEALDRFAGTPEGAEIIKGIVEVVKEQQINNSIRDKTKEVHTKEVAFLNDQIINFETRLASYDKEIEVTRPSIEIQQARFDNRNLTASERMEAKAALDGLQDSLIGLEKNKKAVLAKIKKAKKELAEVMGVPPKPMPLPLTEPEAMAERILAQQKIDEHAARIAAQRELTPAELMEELHAHVVRTRASAESTMEEIMEFAQGVRGLAARAGITARLLATEKIIADFRQGVIDKGQLLVAVDMELSKIHKVLPTLEAVVEPAVKPEGLSTEELIEGKAVDIIAAEEQTAALEGLPERTINVNELEQLRQAANEYIEKQLYSADMSNPLSKAMIAAAHLGSMEEYVKFLPSDIYANVSQEFKDADFADSPRYNLNFQPVVDAVAVIDKGHFGGTLRMKVFQVAEQAQIALLNYQGGWSRKIIDMERALGLERPSWFHFRRRKAWNEMTAAIVGNVTFEEVIVESSELLKKEEIANVVVGLSEEEQLTLVEYGKSMRMFFDEVLAEVNAVRVKLGREPIEYLANYLPWVYRTNIWGRFLGIHLKPDFLAEQALAPDFIKPSTPFNAHALARKGGLAGYEKVNDVRRLFLDYVGVASREMFYTPAITNAKAHARVLKEKGLEVPASYIEDWALRTMAGVPDPLTRWRMENLPPYLFNPVMAVRTRLNPAVFGLNPQWNLFVQTSSIALSNLMTGTKETILGMQYLWNPKARRWVQNNVPAYIIKQKGRGSLIHQDLGATLTEARRIGLSPLETVDSWVTFITRVVEQEITGVTAYAAKLKGEKMGLSDAKLVAFASDGAAKTQSMYDPMHLPQAYSPSIRLLIPFQTFCFEALTRVREMANIKGLPKAGAYETVAADSIEGKGLIKNRAKHFLEFMAIIFVINLVGEFFNKRKPWEASSFVPAANIMMLGIEPSNPWNLPLPARYTNELWKGFDALIEYGNWKSLSIWALRYHFPAGSQAARTLEGTIAAIEGEHKDVSGEVMFELDPEEWLKAVTLGVWKTESGDEYRKRVMEKEPAATKWILEQLEEREGQLGASIEGTWYTLGKYGTEVSSLIRKTGVPEWQILTDIPVYPPLTQFRLYCDVMWEEYYKLPTNQRTKYRRANPYVDASLYFWERVRTLKSNEATEELEKLFNTFIGDNPRAHWRGLPEIPEYIKLLPE